MSNKNIKLKDGDTILYPQTIISNINGLQDSLDSKIDKSNIVDNLTTDDSTKVLSAAQGKILQDNSPFKFGIDSNGNYGYIKAGADTVIPFNNGLFDVIYADVGNTSTNYKTKTGMYYQVSGANKIKYSANNVTWSADATTDYIEFTTNETELNIIFIISKQIASTTTSLYSTGATIISQSKATASYNISEGRYNNDTYILKIKPTDTTVRVGVSMSYGAMYHMILVAS